VAVRIRVPSPAARTMTAAGPCAVTRLGSFSVARELVTLVSFT
jgi:hypothetical protein